MKNPRASRGPSHKEYLEKKLIGQTALLLFFIFMALVSGGLRIAFRETQEGSFSTLFNFGIAIFGVLTVVQWGVSQRTWRRIRELAIATGSSAGAPGDQADEVDAIEKMNAWLSHPTEYGERSVGCTVKKVFHFQGNKIHLLRYDMKSGKSARGFVGLRTWSFIGDQGISDDDLYQAYIGWAHLFGARTGDGSADEKQAVLKRLAGFGVESVEVRDAYKLGDSLILSVTGIHDGKKAKLAISDDGTRIFFYEGMPQYQLPPEFFLIGGLLVS